MFIDYVPLLLINMSAGFFLLAWYVYKGIDDTDQKKWAPAFLIVGLIAVINGLHMVWTWPLPSSYNIAFGEPSVFLGILFLAAAFAFAGSLNLVPVAIYAFFAGIAGVIIGVRIIQLGMTREPVISGMGFILSGLAGVFAAPLLCLRKYRILRIIAAIMLLVSAAIWARTGYMAVWSHLSSLSKWVPATMR